MSHGRRRNVTRSKCQTGKWRYRSQDEAVDHLHQMREKPGGHLPIRAYWCQRCSGWHVTSQPIEGTAVDSEGGE